MGFAEPDAAEDNDVAFFVGKTHSHEVLDLQAVDSRRPVPLELLDGFDHGEACHADGGARGQGARGRRKGSRLDIIQYGIDNAFCFV
jgi:hypothetical protein